MIIRLGIDGSQLDLPQESLTVSPTRVRDFNRQSRTADNSLQTDYTPTKRSFSLKWQVLSVSNYELLESIYTTQVSSLVPLKYSIEDASSIKSYNVYMEPVSRGNEAREIGYMYNVTLTLEET